MFLTVNRNYWLALASVLVLLGCDRQQAASPDKTTNQSNSAEAFSCTNASLLDQMKQQMRQTLQQHIVVALNDVDSGVVNQQQFDLWLANTRFDLAQVRTDAANSKPNELACAAQLSVAFPADLWTSAIQARRLIQDNCESDYCYYSLEQQAVDDGLQFNGQQVTAAFDYQVVRSDANELNIQYQQQASQLSFMKQGFAEALRLPYLQERQARWDAENQRDQQQRQQEIGKRLPLVMEAMRLRLEELSRQNEQANNKLNTLWMAAPKTVRTQVLEQQRLWLKQREVECKLEAERPWNDIPAAQREQYNIEYYEWTQDMRETDQKIRQAKCSVQRTSHRVEQLPALLEKATAEVSTVPAVADNEVEAAASSS